MTITQNTCDPNNRPDSIFTGGGIHNTASLGETNVNTVTLHNCIVAENFKRTDGNRMRVDIFGPVEADSDHNLIGVDTNLTGITNNSNGNQIGTTDNPIDAHLRPLANNGGPTHTHALLRGSPAINKGNSSASTDQRGIARPQGRASDIGAYEAALLEIVDQTITEGDSGTTSAVFTVTLSTALSVAVTVNYETISSSAKNGSDFDATGLADSDGASPGILTIPAGQTSGTITVPIVGDTLNEASEVFYVLLSSPTGAVFSKGRASGTIADNDSTPVALSISDVTINEGNSGTRNANFTLSLNGASGQVVSVDVASADGTATAGADYTALSSRTIKFSPGQTQRTVTVPVLGDVVKEFNETFFVNLNNPVNASLADAQGQGTITDDDRAPALTVADVSIAEGNDGTSILTFTVNLSAASGQSISVNYASSNGSAKSVSDYVAKSGTLSFAPGETSKTIDITINGDTTVETNEVLYLVLSNPLNAVIARGRAIGTIQNDDSSG